MWVSNRGVLYLAFVALLPDFCFLCQSFTSIWAVALSQHLLKEISFFVNLSKITYILELEAICLTKSVLTKFSEERKDKNFLNMVQYTLNAK